jgi:hypothetical protein
MERMSLIVCVILCLMSRVRDTGDGLRKRSAAGSRRSGRERMEVLCGESDEMGMKVGIGQRY